MDKNEANCRKAFKSQPKEAFAKTHNAWLAFRAAWYIWHPQEFMSSMERIWAQDDAAGFDFMAYQEMAVCFESEG